MSFLLHPVSKETLVAIRPSIGDISSEDAIVRIDRYHVLTAVAIKVRHADNVAGLTARVIALRGCGADKVIFAGRPTALGVLAVTTVIDYFTSECSVVGAHKISATVTIEIPDETLLRAS